MFNILSLGIGAVALVLTLIAFLPFLGWANWFIIPLSVVGLVFGALSRSTSGRTLNLILVAVGVVRLMLGHGIV